MFILLMFMNMQYIQIKEAIHMFILLTLLYEHAIHQVKEAIHMFVINTSK